MGVAGRPHHHDPGSDRCRDRHFEVATSGFELEVRANLLQTVSVIRRVTT